MNKDEQLRLCLMLAFQSMISQSEDVKSRNTTQKIVVLANLMDEFCDMHLAQAFPEKTIKLSEDSFAIKIDKALNLHIEELQRNEQTQLPQDRETLIQYYDRLQQRKTRRNQWLFYAEATREQLADLVLKHLDEEIEGKNMGGCQ